MLEALTGYRALRCPPADFPLGCPTVYEHPSWQAHRLLGYLIEFRQANAPSRMVRGGQLLEAFAGP